MFRFSRLLCLLLLVTAASGAPLSVDFNIEGRSDSPAPDFSSWVVPPGRSAEQTFGRISAVVEARDGELQASWWKGGAVDGARLVVDGLTAGPGGTLTVRLRGLRPGPHTIATYHNWTEPADGTNLSGIRVHAAHGSPVEITPTYRVASDADAAVGYLDFGASASGEAVIEFSPTRSDGAVILCGFRLDVPDPRRQASHPTPANRDEHVAAEDGTVQLQWRPATGVRAHHIYVGNAREAVAQAQPGSPEHISRESSSSLPFSVGRHLGDYFWRVDSIDAAGQVTPGEVWRFRVRRLAFPGAEGYGRYAAGGRGGRILRVTTLADQGPGSLRAAVEAEGPRTVVFDVGGLITLESRLTVRNPYLTVAGQTAPGKGITLRGYNFGLLGTHDVIIRHLRVRPGNIAGVTLDGMGMASSDHSIIDHASISWTIDEAFSSRGARNITLQRTLISEALNVAGHKKYRPGTQHGYAASISGLIGSFHHNLLAHNSGRNWSLAGGLDNRTRHTGWLDLRNNVVYNWQNRTTDGGAAKVQFVNNYYRPGPATKVFHLLKPERNRIAEFGPQDYFMEGNVMEGHVTADEPQGGVILGQPGDEFLAASPFFPSHVTTHSARAAFKHVLSDVGTTAPMLDAHDPRIIQETLDCDFTYRGSKTGLPGLPDSQEDVGGWEQYPEVHRAAGWDADGDGLPGWWERIHGLDPHSPSGTGAAETQADADADGYTNLEEYLHWMAEPRQFAAPGATLDVDLALLTKGFTAQPIHRIEAVSSGEAHLRPDGHTLRFTAPAHEILAAIRFSVTDAEGDTMTRTIGVAVVRP